MSRIIVIGFLLAFSACASVSTEDPMPQNGFMGQWDRFKPGLLFEGANLYGHINGGSEVYLELGFDRLEVQKFIHKGNQLSIEIYRMSDPVAALGIFLLNRGEAGAGDPSFRAPHTLNPYQLQFVRGNAYVTVNNLTETPNAKQVLLSFADYAAHRIKGCELGDIFAPLPKAGQVEGSLRIVRGPFTLERVYMLGGNDPLLLGGKETAIAADYEQGDNDPSSLILAQYGSEEKAKAGFENLKTNLDPYLDKLVVQDQRLVFQDYSSKFGEAVLEGTAIRVHVNLVSKPRV